MHVNAAGHKPHAFRAQTPRYPGDLNREPEPQRRNKRRKNTRTGEYDETTRRGKKKRTDAKHMESNKNSRMGQLKNAIRIGPLTIERIVDGKYDWRDANLTSRKRKREMMWNGSDGWEPGGARATRRKGKEKRGA